MVRFWGTVAFRLALGYGLIAICSMSVISAAFYFGTVGLLARGTDAKQIAQAARGAATNAKGTQSDARNTEPGSRPLSSPLALATKRLDEALHQNNGPFADEVIVWWHRNLTDIYGKTKSFHRQNFIRLSQLSDVVTEYLATPWLHNPYLDWVMLDSMTSGQMVATVEYYMQQKHSMAYALSGGVAWKMLLWTLALRPLTFLFGWGLPAVLCYFIAGWSVPVAIAVGVILYGFNTLMLALWLWSKLFSLFTGQRTHLQRAMQFITEMEDVYRWLAGPVMHVGTVRKAFERAAEKGVVWDQQVFCILDRLAESKPRVWSNVPGEGR
jgi:hypothetical protein